MRVLQQQPCQLGEKSCWFYSGPSQLEQVVIGASCLEGFFKDVKIFLAIFLVLKPTVAIVLLFSTVFLAAFNSAAETCPERIFQLHLNVLCLAMTNSILNLSRLKGQHLMSNLFYPKFDDMQKTLP